MAVKWYSFLAGLCFLCLLDVCHPQCSHQADCYSSDITTAYRPFIESVLACRSGQCVCNLCFERQFVLIGTDYCRLSTGCWVYVDYNSTHQTCRRNAQGEDQIGQLEAPTGVLFGGLGLCAVVGIPAFFLWKWCARRNVSFFERHEGFSQLFTVVYFVSLATILGICGIGTAITLGVVRNANCVVERSNVDTNTV